MMLKMEELSLSLLPLISLVVMLVSMVFLDSLLTIMPKDFNLTQNGMDLVSLSCLAPAPNWFNTLLLIMFSLLVLSVLIALDTHWLLMELVLTSAQLEALGLLKIFVFSAEKAESGMGQSVS